ncbi:MAG: hypothetical protein Q8P81_04415 [Nanoarchaeota archaeon]|nr:hypothetical protein [Nanoarchaeota archaeon]
MEFEPQRVKKDDFIIRDETEVEQVARLMGEYAELGDIFRYVPFGEFDEVLISRYRRFRSIEKYLKGLTGEQFVEALEHYQPTLEQVTDSVLYMDLEGKFWDLKDDFDKMRDDFGEVASN